MSGPAANSDAIMQIAARTQVIRHESDNGRWTLARCRPHTALAPYVMEMTGYVEAAGSTVRRREMPVGNTVLIINFGADWLIGDERSPDRPDRFSSFASGVYDRYAISQSTGAAHCMQVNFTPHGARLFFGMPLHEITLRTVDLDDLIGNAGRRLVERLFEAGDWSARFALLEAALAKRILPAATPPDLSLFVWERIVSSAGRVSVSGLAREFDVSRKHLSVSFRHAVGVPPQTYAGIRRFHRAALTMAGTREPVWAEIALDCGYYDQAHFNRDFRRFSGYTPSAFQRMSLDDGTGVLDR